VIEMFVYMSVKSVNHCSNNEVKVYGMQ